ncbi:MAG: hypothetical protein ACLTEH_02130 [Clostridia bacterium]
MSIEPIKIRETFYDFFMDHPELKVEEDSQWKILKVIFPPEANFTSCTQIGNQVLEIAYTYKDKSFYFSVW